MKSTVKNKIKYGKVDLPKDAFEGGQFRMTMWIDLDLLQEIRKQAEASGMKYQPWINHKLREVVMNQKSKKKPLDRDLKESIREIVREELEKAS